MDAKSYRYDPIDTVTSAIFEICGILVNEFGKEF